MALHLFIRAPPYGPLYRDDPDDDLPRLLLMSLKPVCCSWFVYGREKSLPMLEVLAGGGMKALACWPMVCEDGIMIELLSSSWEGAIC